MRETKRRYALIFWLGSGWLLGAAGVNRLFVSGLINGQALYRMVTDGWMGAMEGQRAAVFRIAAVRTAQTAAAAGICRSRMHNLGIPVLLVLAGLSGSAAAGCVYLVQRTGGTVVVSDIRISPSAVLSGGLGAFDLPLRVRAFRTQRAVLERGNQPDSRGNAGGNPP